MLMKVIIFFLLFRGCFIFIIIDRLYGIGFLFVCLLFIYFYCFRSKGLVFFFMYIISIFIFVYIFAAMKYRRVETKAIVQLIVETCNWVFSQVFTKA